jgi:hypothetical protein
VTRNRTSTRFTIEKLARDCLDVRDLRRKGLFGEGWVTIGASLKWPRIVRMRIARYRLVLDLRGHSTPQNIRVSWTRVHLGGERPWVHCPHCERRVARLYRGLGGYFCRACVGNPIYASQALSTQARPHFQACKLRLMLGGEASPTTPVPKRPRGMHQRKYQRLSHYLLTLESDLSPHVRSREPDYPNLVAYLD